MKFFREKRVHNIYLLTSVILFVVGFFISTYSKDRDFVFGTGKVLQHSFGVLCVLLVILYVLPRKVFFVWKYVSIPFIIYILGDTLNSPIFGSCPLFNCNRYANSSFETAIFSLVTLSISLITAFLWHIVEKRKK